MPFRTAPPLSQGLLRHLLLQLLWQPTWQVLLTNSSQSQVALWSDCCVTNQQLPLAYHSALSVSSIIPAGLANSPWQLLSHFSYSFNKHKPVQSSHLVMAADQTACNGHYRFARSCAEQQSPPRECGSVCCCSCCCNASCGC